MKRRQYLYCLHSASAGPPFIPARFRQNHPAAHILSVTELCMK